MMRVSEVQERRRKYWKKKTREEKKRGKGMVYMTIPYLMPKFIILA
jgi:hypothetical protein